MDFCARNELDSELAALLTKLYLAIDAAHKTKALAALPFSEIDNDDFKQLFEKTPDYGFTEAEFDNAVEWFNLNFYKMFQFPAPPRITDNTNAMPFSGIDNDDLNELFPKTPKNYDIAYDEDGEWSYYRGEWLLSCPAGHNPLDYPMIDDYDSLSDLD
jgi:hypothetical protein